MACDTTQAGAKIIKIAVKTSIFRTPFISLLSLAIPPWVGTAQ